MTSFHNESTERLCKAFLTLKNVREVEAFLTDLCTIKEFQDMAQRLDTAILLEKGENYKNICQTVGISTATISRVSRSINYGEDGYKTVLARLKEEE